MSLCVMVSLLPLVCSATGSLAMADVEPTPALQRYDGDWVGTLTAPGVELPLVLHISNDATPPATLDSPSQGAFRPARAGIATIRYEDRGTGESTGSFEGATSRDFAADAAAALAVFSAREDIGTIGFLGHSEGALVAPLAIVEQGAAADFIVALAGPFRPMREIIARQVEDALRLAGADESTMSDSLRLQNRILDAALLDGLEAEICRAVDAASEGLAAHQRQEAGTLCRPWLQTLLRLDPVAIHQAAAVATLALFGQFDRQVAADPNAAAARDLSSVEVRIVEGANHLFQRATTGAVSEYREIEETMREDVMATIGTWINAR